MNIAIQTPIGQKLATGFLASRRQNLIGGKWTDAKSGKTFEVINPADGQVIAHVAAGEKEDIDLAVAAARDAFDNGPWTKMTPAQRAKLIWKLGDAIDANADELALIETLDNGKPLKIARIADVAGSAEKLRYYAGWATKITGNTLDTSLPGSFHAFTLREPVGVCGLIVPWNFPLMMAISKIAPALAAGCTVILKPAEQTPLSAIRLGELIQEVGFPDGVINIVTGFGETAGAAIVDHPGVDKVSFTGSTEVGKLILKSATGNLKRVTLELGGKSPVVVFPDADMKNAIEGASRSIFFNTGQVCAAGSRLFAHQKVFDELIDGIAANARKIKVGPGVNPDTDMGPVVSQEQLERVTSYMKAGEKAGAKIKVGGGRIGAEGYFVEPTILTNTTADMSVRREEIFGPVLCAMSFTDENLDRIAAEANDTSYGLAAQIFTRDLSTAHKMARKLKAGSIRINGGSLDNNVPFGGYKQSGWGRENGREGVEAFTEVKAVTIAL
jgi:phenylacetaldehyde dehydrogenase